MKKIEREAAEMAELYVRYGLTTEAIGKRFGMDPESVYYRLKRYAGITQFNNTAHVGVATPAKVREMAFSGLTVKEIALKLKISTNRVLTLLRESRAA